MSKKILVITKTIDNVGGVQSQILNFYRSIDDKLFTMDFIVPHRESEVVKESKNYKNDNNTVHYSTSFHNSKLRRIRDLYLISKQYEKDTLIHIHVTDGSQSIDGLTFKLLGFKNIVYHSHNASDKNNFGKRLSEKIFTFSGSYFIGCTEKAGSFLFGKKIVKNKNFYILPNSIDTDKFKFDNLKRSEIRRKLEITDEQKLVLFAGRLSDEKNISFLIDLISNMNDKKTVFLLIGEGPYEKKLLEEKLINSIYLGPKKNINDYMSAADIFVLPSKYESFGIVLLEAQASGLPIIASHNVPNDSIVNKNVYFLDLVLKLWIEKINCINANGKERQNKINDKIREFDNDYVTLKLEKLYINFCREK